MARLYAFFFSHASLCSVFVRGNVNKLYFRVLDDERTSQSTTATTTTTRTHKRYSHVFYRERTILRRMQRLRTSRSRVNEVSPFVWVPCRAIGAARLNAARSNKGSRWPFAGDIPRPNPSRSSFGLCTYASAGTLPRSLATPIVIVMPQIPGCWRSSNYILGANK